MRKIIIAAISTLALAGCGSGGWIERETGLTPAEQSQITLTVIRKAPCVIADAGGFGNTTISNLDAAACRLQGGTVIVQ